MVAADAIHTAGPGDVVQVIASREAAEALSPAFVPVDHAIVALVDQIDGTAVSVKVGTVTGSVVSTIHHRPVRGTPAAALCARRLGAATSSPSTSSTPVVGDRVLILDEGTGARQILGVPSGPVRSVIVGIVDEIVGDEVEEIDEIDDVDEGEAG